jgi:leucyl aminopeptidase
MIGRSFFFHDYVLLLLFFIPVVVYYKREITKDNCKTDDTGWWINMKIQRYAGPFSGVETEALGLFLFKDQLSPLDKLEAEMAEHVRYVIETSKFKAEKGKILSIPMGKRAIRNCYIVGLGDIEKADHDVLRYCSGELMRRVSGDNISSLIVSLPEDPDLYSSRAVTEGVLLASYSFDKYKTKKEEQEDKADIETVHLMNGNEEGIRIGTIFAEAQNYSRDLVNEPGNVINPASLADKAEGLAREYGLSCEVWDEKKIYDEGMLGLWHVGKGSSVPPRFIHITYVPDGEPSSRLVFVGKGITFDSGGLNIKPGEHMRDMKGDKTGACNVLGLIRGVGEIKPAVEVHVLIGAAENMPGGNSYRPDDIIRARNGKTIEIDNTDAEGRVTLADTLSYASELKPDIIVDMATLTGACVVALGNYTAGLFTNMDKAGQAFLDAASRSGERFWKLPMDDEKLREQIRSPFADVLNTGGRWGGAITAAMFLEAFVEESIPWVHLDIAGVDSYKKPFGYNPEGASGFGVRTCLELVQGFKKN